MELGFSIEVWIAGMRRGVGVRVSRYGVLVEEGVGVF